MSRSLRRLLKLRERLQDVARMELHVSRAALNDVEEALAHRDPPDLHAVRPASALHFEEMLRDLTYKQRDRLAREVVERQYALGRAKQQQRQIEILVQKRDDEQAQRVTSKEAATLDDWFRAATWEGER